MILFSYFSRQVLQSTLAVGLILLVVSFTSRFLQYLGDAVVGKITIDILVLLMAYRLPEFLLVILPFAFFLSVLLVYGRMYADNEMTVLSACGFSQRRLLALTLGLSVLVAGVVAVFSLQVAPAGLQQAEQLRQIRDELTEIDLIVAGQFQSFDRGMRVTYAETLSETEAGRQLNNTFVVMHDDNAEQSGAVRIILAETARPVIEPESGRRFMLMENGHYYDGVPGQADYQITRFGTQAILLPEQTAIEPVLRERALSTPELWGSSVLSHQSELQWRLSLIVLVPILALMAVPLSKVEPRQGRYARLVPAAMLYGIYLVLLNVARDAVESGELPSMPGLWLVHAVFLIAGILMHTGLPQRRPPSVALGAGTDA